MDETQTTGDARVVIGKNGNKLTPFTHATSRIAAQKRWDKYRQQAAKRVLGEIASIAPDVQTPADAWGVLVARTATAIMDSDRPRGDDMMRVGQAMGALPLAHEREQAQAQAGATLTLSPDIARALVDQLVAGRQVIEGQVVADGQADIDAETDKEQG